MECNFMSKSNYNQVTNSGSGVHFSKALFGEVETSRMTATPVHLTTFNAGDLVPVYCAEVLPDDYFEIDVDFVIRQTTLLTPTMGNMEVDLYAFFVPNRIVNQSFKAVMGENYNGSWTANSVSLAPLVHSVTIDYQVPVGSVADYYGFPTQRPIPGSVLGQCHDLKFRGYVMIYNEWFRDQNYQPPIPLSTLNVYQGFFDSRSSNNSYLRVDMVSDTSTYNIGVDSSSSDGSFPSGAVMHSLYGSAENVADTDISGVALEGQFYALGAPLKVNKLHDYFTSVLPSPQKSQSSIFAPVSGQISSVPVITSNTSFISGVQPPLRVRPTNGGAIAANQFLGTINPGTGGTEVGFAGVSSTGTVGGLYPTNLITQAGAEVTGLGMSVDDIRMAAAIQQVYETLARGGSRYREYISSFFGIEVEDPFSDIPCYLGHIRRNLDLYQTAQTSASESGSTPQGNLAAFGYTANGGHLFSQKFVEHGYVHIFACVRHKNIYPSYLARDNFRLNMLDFYQPQLANISEQPVYAREINPFAPNPNNPFGYQEAWAEYRFEPDRVTGYMRPGIDSSLDIWNYADNFDSGLQISTGEWLKSNSEDVLNRSLAVTSAVSHQFKAQFRFVVDKTRPMPTYSVPGMDII